MGQSPSWSEFSDEFVVRSDGLDAFVRAVQGDSKTLAQSMMDIADAMANLPVNFMGGGLAEGRDFGNIYFPCADALMAFQTDVVGGLATLAGGAAMAALTYVDGDTSSSEQVAAVTDAFAPPPAAPPPSPDDLRRWFAAVRAGEDDARERWEANELAFAEAVEEQRPVIAARDGSPDGDGGAEPFSSDYYDDSGYPHRETVGSGGAFTTVANDDEHVANTELPDLGEDDPGSDAISDRELGSIPSTEFPDDVRDDLRDVGPVPPALPD